MTNIQAILSLLHIAIFPISLGKGIRLISAGQRVVDINIGQIQTHLSKNTKMLHLCFEVSGGAGTKEMQKIAARNSLAASLLEKWTSIRVGLQNNSNDCESGSTQEVNAYRSIATRKATP